MNGVHAVSKDPHWNPQTFSLSSEVVTLSFYLDLFASETKYYQNNNKFGNIFFFFITMNIVFYDWFSIKKKVKL